MLVTHKAYVQEGEDHNAPRGDDLGELLAELALLDHHWTDLLRDLEGAEALLAFAVCVGQQDGPEWPQKHWQRPHDQSGQKLQETR